MIQLASRRYGEWSTLAEKLIHMRCRDYVHSELVFSDGMSFSSSAQKVDGDVEGVRIKWIDYSKHPERWRLDGLVVPEPVEKRMRFKAGVLTELGLGYDFRGIIGFAITGHHNSWKYFCSEAVYDIVASEIFLSTLNYKMDPQRLQEVWQEICQEYDRMGMGL